MDRRSPPKLPSLPEDISSRIIRSAGKGAVSYRHQEIARQERLDDAGTKPFTVREATWLAHNYSESIYIFGSYQDLSAEVFNLSMTRGPLKHRITLNKHQYFNIYSRCDFDEKIIQSMAYEPRIDVASILVNCLDTRVRKNRESTLVLDEMEDYYDRKITADTVLPDVKCIYSVLCLRFRYIRDTKRPASEEDPNNQILDDSWVNKQAKKYTKQALDNIVEDFAPATIPLVERTKLPFLLLFFAG